jgi:hypothetical protein
MPRLLGHGLQARLEMREMRLSGQFPGKDRHSDDDEPKRVVFVTRRAAYFQ